MSRFLRYRVLTLVKFSKKVKDLYFGANFEKCTLLKNFIIVVDPVSEFFPLELIPTTIAMGEGT